MDLLVETEPRKSIWQDNPEKTTSWNALLREQSLCTPTLYHDFKKAKKLLNVDIFGVYASVALVKLKVEYRARITNATQRWVEAHKVPPTYQRITKYVRELRKELGIRGKPSTPIHAMRHELNSLARQLNKAHEYIEVLQASLKTHNIRIPREP
jgi:hypothetical protein